MAGFCFPADTEEGGDPLIIPDMQSGYDIPNQAELDDILTVLQTDERSLASRIALDGRNSFRAAGTAFCACELHENQVLSDETWGTLGLVPVAVYLKDMHSNFLLISGA